MITRFRIEAIGKTQEQVRVQLVSASEELKLVNGGMDEWEVEPGLITAAKEGFWGHTTWRVKDAV